MVSVNPIYFLDNEPDSRMSAYRKELPKEVGTDEYPLPMKFLGPLEMILQKRLGWDSSSAVDVCCTAENRRYEKYLDDSFNTSWRDHGKFIFCMTPYSNVQKDWAAKCIQEANKGCVVVALYAFKEKMPQKWIQSMIMDRYFNISMGRIRLGQWKASPYDHLLVVYGKGRLGSLRKDLSLLRWHMDNKVTIKRVSVICGITVDMCVRMCNSMGLLTAIGNLPVTSGRSNILWHEIDLVQKYMKKEIQQQEIILNTVWGFTIGRP